MSHVIVYIIAAIFTINLIITAIIGLRRKEIDVGNIYYSILLAPAGWILRLMFYILGKFGAFSKKEYGEKAVIASVSLLAFALMSITFFGSAFIDEYGLFSENAAETFAVGGMVAVIMLLPLFMAVHNIVKRRKSLEK
jgi:hypothetical protein